MTLDDVRGSWTIRGSGTRACFSAWTHTGKHGVGWKSANVRVRRKPGENVMEMVARGLAVLADRLANDAPKRVKKTASRQQRERAEDAFRRLDYDSRKVH